MRGMDGGRGNEEKGTGLVNRLEFALGGMKDVRKRVEKSEFRKRTFAVSLSISGLVNRLEFALGGMREYRKK